MLCSTLTHFSSLLAIAAVLVAARISPAIIESRYAVSGPSPAGEEGGRGGGGGERPSFFASAAASAKEVKVKRSLAAAVEPQPPKRLASRYSAARKECEFIFFSFFFSIYSKVRKNDY